MDNLLGSHRTDRSEWENRDEQRLALISGLEGDLRLKQMELVKCKEQFDRNLSNLEQSLMDSVRVRLGELRGESGVRVISPSRTPPR